MKSKPIRTTVDIPASFTQLRAAAAKDGPIGIDPLAVRSLSSRASVLVQRVKFPLIASDGPKVDLTNNNL